jgi:hypothetical protein
MFVCVFLKKNKLLYLGHIAGTHITAAEGLSLLGRFAMANST